ncbi:TSC22 domain family protein 1-like isoform X3 [Hemibagrus wyckioides]|uniref:TSC22 domain family protein 1-like isoform X3 n=1 Tax=Hemibagrus wyckioides TaxID=337641 RepID=UPI00266DB941|nr:TSC22 domain family protein 1-like isoform X3 [Hemibagrus wyckioides]
MQFYEMHQSESNGDSLGTKKLAHASVFTSRGGSDTESSATSGSLNAVSMTCNAILTDDHKSLLIHNAPSAGSSSPHHNSTCLNVHMQPQSHQSAGAQVKKKSGFQITSVLPAQVSASTNNSIADDTESYDDMDESHTEDLSSSDILDVSVSRATDTGIPEKSSSEETLNSLHGGETPGVISPNEPGNLHLHTVQPGYMLNGTIHHHNHHKDEGMTSMPTPQQLFHGVTVYSSSRDSNALSPGTTVQSVVQSRTQRSASVQAAAVDVSATGKVDQILFSASGSASGTSEAGMPGCVIGSNAIGGGLLGTTLPIGNSTTGITALQPSTASSTAQIQSSTAIASRFRVVKLDSSSEPYRKGRWMCTEYYEKEAPAAAPFTDAASSYQSVDSFVHSESESTSGDSSCSMMSGLGDQGIQPNQQTCVPPGVSVLHPSLSQNTSQLHTHSQDAGIHILTSPPVAPPKNPQVVLVPSLLGTESQPSVDYAQGTQAPAQSQQMLPVQSSVTPRATSGPSFPAGTLTMTVPQSVSPRPHISVPQMVVLKGSTINQVQQHQLQMPTEQQQQAISNQPPQPMLLNTGQTTPSIASSSVQSNIQPAIPPFLLHEGLVGDHSGGLGLALHHQGGQSFQIPSARDSYSSVAPLIASQLEDAGRLLFQHQSLLSLPRLATGSVSGLTGQCGSEASTSFGQEGSSSALAISAGTDEDSMSYCSIMAKQGRHASGSTGIRAVYLLPRSALSSLGTSVVAIDNKIEQAMDLVKSHLMYAVREEVEVLKEQIKDLIERNFQLEQENNLLKNLASPEQLAQFQAQQQDLGNSEKTTNSTLYQN